MILNWTYDLPVTTGIYIYKPISQWVWYLVEIKQGDWRLAQNPNWYYVSGLPGSSRISEGPISMLEFGGMWLGPISEPEGYDNTSATG